MRTIVARDEGAARLGEVALVDGEGRIGALDTVFYDTLLDENAASHIALGQGFPFLAATSDREPRSTRAQIHIDFMIGSPGADGHRHHRRRRARAGARRGRLADLSARYPVRRSRRGAGAAERARLEIV